MQLSQIEERIKESSNFSHLIIEFIKVRDA